ncbi:MAG: phosphoglucosamine mutase, partial [Desulfuromonas sp.]
QRGKLADNTVVATVMSNMGLDKTVRAAGGKVIKTNVGDRYVVEAMREHGYNLGGEQSGHMVFLDHSTTGDGMLSALQILAIMQRSQRRLSELAQVMTSMPQVLLNVRVDRKAELESVPAVQKTIDHAEKSLGDDGRVLIRYSGTEPLLRIMLEGEDEQQIMELAQQIATSVEESLGGRREEH